MVIAWLKRELLTDAMLERVLADLQIAHASVPEVVDAQRESMAVELRRITMEVERLGEAIATGGVAVDVLVRKIREREVRARELQQQLAARPSAGVTPTCWETIKKAALARLADLRDLFDRNIEGAREVLTSLLQGAIQCRVVEVEGRRRFHLTGEAILPGLEQVTQETSPEGYAQTPPIQGALATGLKSLANSGLDTALEAQPGVLPPELFHLAA